MKVSNRLDQMMAPLGELSMDMGQLVEHWFGDRRGSSTGYVPRTDIVETKTEYEICMELPGVAHEDVNVEVLEGRLVIAGDKRVMQQDGRNIVRAERAHGPFKRSFEFADQVDFNKIDATFRDGVLSITVPKSERVLPRKIQIKGASNSETGKGSRGNKKSEQA